MGDVCSATTALRRSRGAQRDPRRGLQTLPGKLRARIETLPDPSGPNPEPFRAVRAHPGALRPAPVPPRPTPGFPPLLPPFPVLSPPLAPPADLGCRRDVPGVGQDETAELIEVFDGSAPLFGGLRGFGGVGGGGRLFWAPPPSRFDSPPPLPRPPPVIPAPPSPETPPSAPAAPLRTKRGGRG